MPEFFDSADITAHKYNAILIVTQSCMYVNNSYLSEMNIMSQAKRWKANQWKTMPINKVAQSTDHTRFV